MLLDASKATLSRDQGLGARRRFAAAQAMKESSDRRCARAEGAPASA